MILSNADMDFVQGFVKQAFTMGLTEAQAAIALVPALEQWKMRTEGEDTYNALKKSAFVQGIKSFGVGLKGLAKGTGKGLGTMGKGIINRPKTSLGVAGGTGAALLGTRWYNGLQNDEAYKLDSRGAVPGTLPSSSSGSDSGSPGTYSPSTGVQNSMDADGYSGATYNDQSSGAGTATTAGAAASGTQWDQKFKSTHGEIKNQRDKLNKIDNQISSLAASNLNPVQRQQQQVALEAQRNAIQSSISSHTEALGKADETLRNQEQDYDRFRLANEQKLTQTLQKDNDRASTWARRQEEARNGNWYSRPYYGLRNWLTGDNSERGDELSQRLQAQEALRQRLQSQPDNYYHND